MKKAFLIVPPSIYEAAPGWEFVAEAPLEGAVIAVSLLINEGWEVKALNLRSAAQSGWTLEGLLAQISSADVLVLAGSPDGFIFIRELVTGVRRELGDLPVLVGGSLASSNPETLLHVGVTTCLIGECEDILIATIKSMLAGISQPLVRATRPVPSELWPDYDFSPWGISRGVCLSTQRGCLGRCKFCSNPSRAWRARQSEQLSADLQALRGSGVTQVFLNDPTFNTNANHAMRASQLLGKAGMAWSCMIRATPAIPGLFPTMKASGCQAVFLGIESGDQRLLNSFSKGVSLKQIQVCIETAQAAGLVVVGFFILGLPGESRESLALTQQFIKRNQIIPRTLFATPYPGTEMYGAAIRGGMTEVGILEWISTYSNCGPKGRPFPNPGVGVNEKTLREAMAWMDERVHAQDR